MHPNESAIAAREAECKMAARCKGYPTVTEAGPMDHQGPICREGPFFGIAGWTGVIYDSTGYPVGCVSECDWVVTKAHGTTVLSGT